MIFKLLIKKVLLLLCVIFISNQCVEAFISSTVTNVAKAALVKVITKNCVFKEKTSSCCLPIVPPNQTATKNRKFVFLI